MHRRANPELPSFSPAEDIDLDLASRVSGNGLADCSSVTLNTLPAKFAASLTEAQANRKASLLRKEAALELSDAGWSPSKIASTHYAPFKGKIPLKSGNSAFEFNEAITDHVLRNSVLPLLNPADVTMLGSKVIEQTFYYIFDPAEPEKPVKNLSVSKHHGVFFTPADIAGFMANQLKIGNRERRILLDPCVGSGALLSAALCSGAANYEKMIGVELDPKLASWSEALLRRVSNLVGYFGEIEIRVGDGLEYLLSSEAGNYASDMAVVINPPYGRIRLTADRATNAETRFNEDHCADEFKSLQDQVLAYGRALKANSSAFSGERGILEISRLFFRACAAHAVNGSRIAIISPDSWMSGPDAGPLRRALFDGRLIQSITLIPEDGKRFATVNQATAITILDACEEGSFLVGAFDEGDPANKVSYADLRSTKENVPAIPKLGQEEMAIYEDLSAGLRFRDVAWLENRRGEVDQTLNKQSFSIALTEVPLIRGDHLTRFRLMHESTDKKPGFMNVKAVKSLLEGKPKEKHFKSWRIAGRQCSYALQRPRLIFCCVPPNHALGNSCNYLVVSGDKERQEMRTYALLGLLNSGILDWYFRVQNSNNHVANYEIDSFPFPAKEDSLPLIASIAYQLEHTARGRDDSIHWLEDMLNAAVAVAYGLNTHQLEVILANWPLNSMERALNYERHLSRGVRLKVPEIGCAFFNNEEASLSELDRLTISHVPEGGNWQNIPIEVPSERLRQIRQMTAERGVVRTTYYGRLRRDQPAYTINTYFNRPGNGTHIHPTLPRTLTAREAARLQSFPDRYVFAGPDASVRNQIGNAVPPLLAQALGERLLPFATSGLAVDVFCGAGGLSLGLEAAGWTSIAAIDFDKAALDTYAVNRPSVLEPEFAIPGRVAVLRRDLHDDEAIDDVTSRISKYLGGRSLDLMVGGPPCQGFSHAGFRQQNDRRNDLAVSYLKLANTLRPRIFVLENVEGLLTFKKGQVLADICKALSDMGYEVSMPVWKLHAEQYGVPQMRRRIFVVATIGVDAEIAPPTPQYEKCAGRREHKSGGLLQLTSMPRPFSVADALAGLSLPAKSMDNELAQWLSRSKKIK